MEAQVAAISGGDVHLAVDMSGVTFIDASGIGVLVAAANRARRAEGGLSLLALSRQVQLLDVLYLEAILPAAPRSGAPSLPAAPPDASPRACCKDEGRCVSRRPPRARVPAPFTACSGR